MSVKSDFEDIAMAHLDAVYRAGFALCGQRDVAGDLVQTTYLKAFEKFGSFEKGTNCKAWLMRILRNTWIDRLRRRKFTDNQVSLDGDVADPAGTESETVWSNAEDLIDNFSDENVIEALKSLPDQQRFTLYLIDVEGLSQEDVARITDVATGTVKSRTSRARMALKKSLTDYARDMGLLGREK